MTLGERIRRWRAWAELSQSDLAAKVGVSGTAVSYWERDESHKKSSHPTHENVEKIAKAIGITVPMFFSDPPAKKRPS